MRPADMVELALHKQKLPILDYLVTAANVPLTSHYYEVMVRFCCCGISV